VIVRIAAAAVGLAVLLPAVIWGGLVAVEIIIWVVSVVCVAEYAAMAFPRDRWAAGIAVFVGFAAVFAAAMHGPPGSVGAVIGVGVVAAMIFVTLRPGPTLDGAADRCARLLLGVGWIGQLAFLPLLRQRDHGLAWVFLVLAASWLGDTGAYFSGRFLGRTPLYPKVSPKKTWEGVAGGITLATVGTFVIRAVALPELSVADCALLGPGLCLAGVIGDLSESMLKRSFDVKDSGWIMPGHGGLLDRIDSVLFVGSTLYAYVAVRALLPLMGAA
jgi:phosphatidate cytidylyltransferase